MSFISNQPTFLTDKVEPKMHGKVFMIRKMRKYVTGQLWISRRFLLALSHNIFPVSDQHPFLISITNGRKPSQLPQRNQAKILPWWHSSEDKSLILFWKHVAAFLFSFCVCTRSHYTWSLQAGGPACQPKIRPTIQLQGKRVQRHVNMSSTDTWQPGDVWFWKLS